MGEKVSLVIDGESFDNFTEVEFNRSIDTFSTMGFLAPFEADRKEFRKLFRPFTYRSVNGLIADKVQFTGTLMTPDPQITESSKSVAVSCYSLPAVMCDCCPPGGAYPLEFAGHTILQIAQTLASKFGLIAKLDENVSDDESDHAFQKAKLKRGPRGGRGKRGN
jgi:prophage tail gpP-like protein